jgi:hypothetical protein
MVKAEFPAYQTSRAFVNQLRLSKQEIAESVYYKHFTEAPQDLETYMSVIKESSMKDRDFFKEYEIQYDALRRQGSLVAPGSGP